MKKILTLATIFLLVYSCTNKKIDYSEITEVIKMDQLEELQYSSEENPLLSEIDYLPLITTNETYRLGTLSKVIAYDDKYYIIDKRIKRFVVFNSQGKSEALVGNRGRGPGEYVNIADFDIDKLGNVHLVDGNTDRLNIYGPGPNYEFIETGEHQKRKD